jgi:uncharacterized protein (DUF58 family)
MFSGLILIATILLALSLGILLGWGILSIFLYAMSRRPALPKAQSATVPHPQPSIT